MLPSIPTWGLHFDVAGGRGAKGAPGRIPAFLDRWSKSILNRRLAIVPDNLNTHTNEAARKWLKSRSLVSFHFTRDPRFMGKPH
jgi:hypothetical protein